MIRQRRFGITPIQHLTRPAVYNNMRYARIALAIWRFENSLYVDNAIQKWKKGSMGRVRHTLQFLCLLI